MPILKSGEARIHYVLEGQSASPVLAFSNSLGANYSMWDSQAREFHKKFRVLRCDTRGHGQSSAIPGPYSIEQLAKDVVALLDQLDLDRIHFCGLSMGAKIGTLDACNARIEAVRKNGMKSIAPAVVERWFTPAFRQKSLATISNTLKMIEEANPDGYSACCAAIRDCDYREQVGAIRAPTLVISGAHDPATP